MEHLQNWAACKNWTQWKKIWATELRLTLHYRTLTDIHYHLMKHSYKTPKRNGTTQEWKEVNNNYCYSMYMLLPYWNLCMYFFHLRLSSSSPADDSAMSFSNPFIINSFELKTLGITPWLSTMGATFIKSSSPLYHSLIHVLQPSRTLQHLEYQN